MASSKMQSNPMLRSLSTDSSQKRDWKQRLSLRDNRRRDPLFATLLYSVIHVGRSEQLFINHEDKIVIEKTIQKFGSPQPFEFNFPGAELSEDVTNNKILTYIDANSGNYSFKIRTANYFFSYNERYEVGEFKKIGDEEVLVAKGQYAQLLPRDCRSYYIRTIGYIDDEKSYHQFLIEMLIVNIVPPHESMLQSRLGGPVTKSSISSSVLISFSGVNALG